MHTSETRGHEPEETKKENGETSQAPQPENAEAKKNEAPQPDEKKQADEISHRITPADPDITPKDTTRDGKDRWESESPAVKGHPQQNIPEDVNAEKTENPDGDDEDLLKKRDETGIA